MCCKDQKLSTIWIDALFYIPVQQCKATSTSPSVVSPPCDKLWIELLSMRSLTAPEPALPYMAVLSPVSLPGRAIRLPP